ncbi:MAG: hypothetical protein RL331_325 [Bacteroidota bacterium]|jgi:hypothetical protein
MKNQVKDPLDKLFSGLQNVAQESPSPAFLQDLEARLDALDKKRRKPLLAWWIFSALGAVMIVGTYFLLVPTRAKSTVPNKLASLTRTTPLSTSKSTSKSTSSLSISNATTLSSTSFATSTSTTLTSPISKVAAPSTEIIAVEQETYVINPILLSDNHPIDSAISVYLPLPVIQDELTAAKKRVQHQVGLQFGVSGIFSSFEVPTSNPLYTATELKQFRTEREIGERQTSSWDFNLRYGLCFDRWQLQTGLQYFEWGEQLQYEVISVSGTNRYRYVNVPVLLGYTFNLGKVQLVPFAGAAVGKGFSTQGTYIQPQINGVALANAKQIAATLIGQVELQYHLTPQLLVTCTPVYRRTLGALVDNGLVVNRYQSLGLLTGFMYKF